MLKEKIRRLLSFGSNVVFTMTYADEDGDMVILATEDDLRDILPQSLNPLRITKPKTTSATIQLLRSKKASNFEGTTKVQTMRAKERDHLNMLTT
ncbi:protein NBR1 [Tanacetum coccineum]